MPVLLARRRIASAEPAPVHAFRVPGDPASVPVWRSVCGIDLPAAEAEVLGQYTGAPCSVCLMATISEQAAHTTQQQRTRVGTRPAMQPVSPTGHYAAALAGERTTHLVRPHAPRSTLDGEQVVQGLCGFLGWGPLVSPPAGFSICTECSHAHRDEDRKPCSGGTAQ